jgi:hypothetical protein
VNRTFKVASLLSLVCVLMLNAQQSQPPTKVPLVVVCGCDESDSRMLESAVRDAVAVSPRYYELRPGPDDKTPYYRLVLVAIDDDVSSIAVSFVVLHVQLLYDIGRSCMRREQNGVVCE